MIAKGPILGVRYIQTLLLFFCFVNNFSERLVVSVTLVAMTNAASTNPNFPEYGWTPQEISYIISCAFWGIVIGVLPGGFLCQRLGAKITMLISILGSSLCGITVPICVPFGGWAIYCIIRICQGLFQGLFFPSVATHLAKWSPIQERTLMGAFSHSGLITGTILAILISGFIAKSSLGWPGISYIANGAGLVLCVFWMVLADNSPTTSRFISEEEKQYILSSQQKVEGNEKKIPIPWKAILTSRPMLSYVAVQLAETWGHTTVLAQLPLYMRGVHKMDITSNAINSALPYMAMFVMSYVYMFTTGAIMKRNIVSLTVFKKTINTIAMWLPAACLIVVGFVDETHKILAIVLMVVAVGSNAGVTIGQALNAIELSPNHASILTAIVFGATGFMGIITPLYAGFIVTNQNDASQWQIVFLTAALLYFFGNLQYLFFGTTDTQPWDDEDFLVSKDDCESTAASKEIEKISHMPDKKNSNNLN